MIAIFIIAPNDDSQPVGETPTLQILGSLSRIVVVETHHTFHSHCPELRGGLGGVGWEIRSVVSFVRVMFIEESVRVLVVWAGLTAGLERLYRSSSSWSVVGMHRYSDRIQ